MTFSKESFMSKKKLTKKRLILFIILAIASLFCIIIGFWIGIGYDKYGVKPYITIPMVLLIFISLFLFIYSLLNIYPYAINYDRKKLKKKKFKEKKLSQSFEVIKERVQKEFEKVGEKYVKIKKWNGLFGKIKYTIQFIGNDKINQVVDLLDKNNKKGFDFETKVNSEREVDIFFVETDIITTEIESIEDLLDMQYLDILKDPYKVIIPIVFEKATNKIYYYEKWSKFNITLLKQATNFVLKEILHDSMKLK